MSPNLTKHRQRGSAKTVVEALRRFRRRVTSASSFLPTPTEVTQQTSPPIQHGVAGPDVTVAHPPPMEVPQRPQEVP